MAIEWKGDSDPDDCVDDLMIEELKSITCTVQCLIDETIAEIAALEIGLAATRDSGPFPSCRNTISCWHGVPPNRLCEQCATARAEVVREERDVEHRAKWDASIERYCAIDAGVIGDTRTDRRIAWDALDAQRQEDVMHAVAQVLDKMRYDPAEKRINAIIAAVVDT